MAFGNSSFDVIASTTLQEYAPKLADNIFESQPFMQWIQSGGRMVNWDGGRTIVEPLMSGTNTTTAVYNGYDTLPTAASAGITAAEYNLKQAATGITISGEEEELNSGSPEQVINLLEAKIMQAQESAVMFFDEMFITSDGTGNSSKDWQGLEVLIGGELVSSVCGGIDASDSDNAWWRSEISDGGYAVWADPAGNNSSGPAPAARALLLSEMTNVYNTISDGQDQPGLILTTQGLYESYNALLAPQQRFMDPKTADAGFTNLMFMGTPIVYDDYVSAGEMFFLNHNNGYIKLRKSPRRWFNTTPFMRPYNQDAKVAQILMMGELTINNRRRQGLMSNLIPS
jgi:hypothetical protein